MQAIENPFICLRFSSVVHWDQDEMRSIFPSQKRRGLRVSAVPVTCGLCNKTRWVPVTSIKRATKKRLFTGLCMPCCKARRGPAYPSWRGGRFTDRYGYVQIHIDSLPDAQKELALQMTVTKRYTREHRLLMAVALGRPLASDEIVHHRNGKRDDNRLENLQLLKTKTHHCGWGSYYHEWQTTLVENRQLKQEIARLQSKPEPT